MNVKSLTPTISLPESTKTDTAKSVKSESSSKDRDANGQRQKEQEPEKRKLSDEEFQEALEALENLDGFKTNMLTYEVKEIEDLRIVLVKSPTGVAVRRLLESDLWTLIREKSQRKGQLLNKAM